jgi:hypothetical protein
VLPQQV